MIKTFTGPMFSGKTAAMITEYQKRREKEETLVFKPFIDDRDLGVMKSREFDLRITAICVETIEEIFEECQRHPSVHTVFIDEAEFLKGNVAFLSYMSLGLDMDIFISGLNQTAEQKPFLIMTDLLAISDEIEMMHAYCQDCHEPAPYTYYEGGKDKDIVVGDTNYFPLCPKCLLKRRGEKGIAEALKLTFRPTKSDRTE